MREAAKRTLETRVPARLDRLPWGRFHTLAAVALGITWILDGLEVTLAGSIAGALEASPRLHFTASDIGLASSFYLAGAVGGEYSAVNSTIQEMVPARYRGWTGLAINGTFWIGAALGAVGSLAVLDPTRFAPDVGWRLAFLIGSALGLVIFFLRTWIPESPRWLVIHGKEIEAEKIVEEIESRFRLHGASFPDASALTPMRLRPRAYTPLGQVFKTLFITFRTRTFLGLTLMGAQAF